MILGFTGTRIGLSPDQRWALGDVVAALPTRLIHGGAVGADQEIDEWLAPLFAERTISIEIYPGSPVRRDYWLDPIRSYREIRHVWDVTAPLKRNRLIVKYSDHLIAYPGTMTEIARSGTWATIRYARKTGKPITIVWPNGTISEER